MTFGIVASSHPLTAWSPADEGGLRAWYDVTDLSLSDNDAVSTWADLSGNSRTLQNAFGATHYPTYKTGITPGGQPVVRFDGIDNFLYNATRFSFDTSASVYWFGSAATESGDFRPLSHGGQNVNSGWHFDRFSGGVRAVFTAVTGIPSGAGPSPSGFQCYGLEIDNAASTKGTFRVDMTSEGTTTTAMSTTGSTDVLSVGGLAGAYYAELDMCEIVYFDHVLDATARSNLQTYFENKYL